jgi:hypothetical protein
MTCRDARRRLAAFAFGNLLLLSAVLAASGAVFLEERDRTERLRWMAGCWEEVSDGSTVEEMWMAPKAGTMFGVSRTIRGGATVGHETIRIFERAGRLVYAANPSGQSPTEFTETELSDSLVVFANPAHDFPQFIRYRRQGTRSLWARVYGKMDGKDAGFDSRYRRARCPE